MVVSFRIMVDPRISPRQMVPFYFRNPSRRPGFGGCTGVECIANTSVRHLSKYATLRIIRDVNESCGTRRYVGKDGSTIVTQWC
jgi:hypothetical protein